MAEYVTTDTELTSVANAIRTKGGTSASLAYPTGFVSAIEAIPTGSTLPDATGVYFGKVIVMGSFGITTVGMSYSFEVGMTWNDFIASSYNDGAFLQSGTNVSWNGATICDESGVMVSTGDTIISGYGYTL